MTDFALPLSEFSRAALRRDWLPRLAHQLRVHARLRRRRRCGGDMARDPASDWMLALPQARR